MGIVPDRQAEAIMAQPEPRRASVERRPYAAFRSTSEYRGGGKPLAVRYPARAA